MKKYIWTIAASIMIAGVITIVACSKDNETKQSVNPTFSSTKGGTTLNQLRNVMVAYYAACDSAYQADSTTFLSICANNDTTNFLNVTGITRDMLYAYQTLALSENEDYIHDYPDLIKEVSACSECQEYALSSLGELASQTQGHLSAFVPENTNEINRDHLNRIIYACQCNNPHVMTACISGNMREMAHELLAKKLNVFWEHCDYAYVNSPKLLQTACEKEDFDQFYIITNLTQVFFDEIIGLANVSFNDFILNNPNYDFKGDTCSTCMQTSLSDIWYHIDNIHTISEEIVQYAPNYFDTIEYKLPPVDPCIRWCTQVQPRDYNREKWCYLNCTMETCLLKIQQVLMILEYDANH